MGIGLCSQTLMVEVEYLSTMYCFSRGRFSSVAGPGMEGGEDGGNLRGGQEQGSLSGLTPRSLCLGG